MSDFNGCNNGATPIVADFPSEGNTPQLNSNNNVGNGQSFGEEILAENEKKDILSEWEDGGFKHYALPLHRPSNIEERHWDSWIVDSGIAAEMAVESLSSMSDTREIAGRLNWKAYRGSEGWVAEGIDIETGQLSGLGQFRPDVELKMDEDKKGQKYITFPKGAQSDAIFLATTMNVWYRVSVRYGVAVTDADIDRNRLDHGFWLWVARHPEIDIEVTEGIKKAACLLSHGYVGVCLLGVNNFKIKGTVDRIVPGLKRLLHKERRVNMVFDADIVKKDEVRRALVMAGSIIINSVRELRVVLWNLDDGKGVDDLIASKGCAVFDEARTNADTFDTYVQGYAADDFKVWLLNEELQLLFVLPPLPGNPGFKIVSPFPLKEGKHIHRIGSFALKQNQELFYCEQYACFMVYALSQPGVWGSMSTDWMAGHLHTLIMNRIAWEKALIRRELAGETVMEQIGVPRPYEIETVVKHLQQRKFLAEWFVEVERNHLPFENGVIDLGTGEFKPHSPDHYLTWTLPRKYEPDAKDWSFIQQWLKDVTNTQRHMQIAVCFAAAVLRGRPDLQRYLHLLGDGGTGKSTYMQLVEMLIGRNNCHPCDMKDLDDKHTLVHIKGKRLVTMADQDRVAKGLGMFKRLTGQDTIKGRLLYKNEVTFKFEGMVLITSNKPVIAGEGGSWMTRRAIMLPFDKKPKNPRSLTKDFEAELSAFTNYLLTITDAEIDEALKPGEEIDATLWRAQVRTDSIGAWLDTLVYYAPEKNWYIGPSKREKILDWQLPDNEMPTLYGSYRNYCQSNGLQPKSTQNFSADLEELCRRVLGWDDVHKGRDKTANVFVMHGLALKRDESIGQSVEERLRNKEVVTNHTLRTTSKMIPDTCNPDVEPIPDTQYSSPDTRPDTSKPYLEPIPDTPDTYSNISSEKKEKILKLYSPPSPSHTEKIEKLHQVFGVSGMPTQQGFEVSGEPISGIRVSGIGSRQGLQISDESFSALRVSGGIETKNGSMSQEVGLVFNPGDISPRIGKVLSTVGKLAQVVWVDTETAETEWMPQAELYELPEPHQVEDQVIYDWFFDGKLIETYRLDPVSKTLLRYSG